MMPSSRKGRGQKKVTHVPVPIPISVAEKLELASKGKAIDAPLLTKPSDERWKQSDHSRLFRRAVVGAALDPGEVTLYALRHSSIVRDLLANVPVRIVATKHDTSISHDRTKLQQIYRRPCGYPVAACHARPQVAGHNVISLPQR